MITEWRKRTALKLICRLQILQREIQPNFFLLGFRSPRDTACALSTEVISGICRSDMNYLTYERLYCNEFPGSVTWDKQAVNGNIAAFHEMPGDYRNSACAEITTEENLATLAEMPEDIQSPAAFNLMGLPLELRQRIYGFVFEVDDEPIDFAPLCWSGTKSDGIRNDFSAYNFISHWMESEPFSGSQWATLRLLGLLSSLLPVFLTNKQIYTEASAAFTVESSVSRTLQVQSSSAIGST